MSAKKKGKRTPAKIGRPREHRMTKADYARATRMAAKGASYGTVGRALGMDPKTFRGVRERDENMAEALELGRDDLETRLVSTLFVAATRKKAPYLPGAMFLLKSLRGFRDRGPTPSLPANAVQINISIPAALTEDAYAELVKVTDAKRLPLTEAEADAHAPKERKDAAHDLERR